MRVDVALHLLDRFQRGAAHAKQLVVHPHELLADDVQPAARQQVVHVGDPAGDRVVDRDHGVARLPLAHGARRHPRTSGRAGRPARGTPAGRPGGNRRRRRPGRRSCAPDRTVPDRSCVAAAAHAWPPGCAAPSPGRPGVSTPNGTASTSRTPMLIPFSSARSCSSFSRCSSGLGGRAANRSSAVAREGVDADMMPDRAGAAGCGGAGEVERAAQRRAAPVEADRPP